MTVDKNLVQSFDVVEKRNSIKSRLQRTFVFLATAIVFVMSFFSIGYFYFTNRNEATNLIRNKMDLAQIFLENQKNDTFEFAEQIAKDRALQIGLELNSSERLSSYIRSILSESTPYYVTVFDKTGNTLVDVGKTSSQVFTNRKSLSQPEQFLLSSALEKKASVSTINILNGLHDKFPSFAAAYPVVFNNELLGCVMVRFVFADNTDFFTRLSKNLNADIAIYVDSEPKVETANLEISELRYHEVAFLNKNTENISLASDGLNEYHVLKDIKGEPISVLHVYVSSISYLTVFVTAAGMYILLAILVNIIVFIVVVKVSDTILKPIEKLLKSVNIVRSGDLRHEIILSLNDEIGRLGAAFNELRGELSNKICTIQDMNLSLESKVEERTEQLNSLNGKIKHYLSPQLYNSIVGGEVDTSINQHYRKKLTVFFSDVVNFTATTESLEPEDISALLNDYLDRMAQIAEKYGGTIDKYVGDAVMVFFGDPVVTTDKDHAIRAVKMALEMQHVMISFREEWREKGLSSPFHVRMGINTGYCTIGNFGSETKMDYTIIGNNVNLAARFEAACQPDSILISPDTYALVKDEIECYDAGMYAMKGLAEPVNGYTPLRIKDNTKIKEVVQIGEHNTLIFTNEPLEISRLSKAEKYSILKNMKEAYETIRGVPAEQTDSNT